MKCFNGVRLKKIFSSRDFFSVSLDRVKSGIVGFDELLDGGFIPNRVYLVSGPPGAGKTIFCSQFIYKGILENYENGIYVTLEVSPEQLREDVLSLGWDLRHLEDEDKLIIIDSSLSRLGFDGNEDFSVPRPYTTDALLYEIQKAIQKINAKRIVIDCLDTLDLDSKDSVEFRKILLRLISILKSFKCTCLLIAESHKPRTSIEEAVEFAADGIIKLIQPNETSPRKIEVTKMRGTNNSPYPNPCIISEDGIKINQTFQFPVEQNTETNLFTPQFG